MGLVDQVQEQLLGHNMTIGDEFRLSAQEIIADFSEDEGESTYYSKVIAPTGDYNATTGANTPVFTAHSLLTVSDGLALELASVGNPPALDPQFVANHRLILIAGLDISVVPKIGDEVKPVGETLRLKVALVDFDQYGALYTCYVERQPQ